MISSSYRCDFGIKIMGAATAAATAKDDDDSSTYSSSSNDSSSNASSRDDNDNNGPIMIISNNQTQQQEVQRGTVERRSIASAFESMIDGYMGENYVSSNSHHHYSQQCFASSHFAVVPAVSTDHPPRGGECFMTTKSNYNNTTTTPPKIKKKIVPTSAKFMEMQCNDSYPFTSHLGEQWNNIDHELNNNASEAVVVGADVRYNSAASTTTTTTNNNNNNNNMMVEGTQVYVRDAGYSWLPATIISPFQDDKQRVQVKIHLPSDWEDCTILPSSSTTTTTAAPPPPSSSSSRRGGRRANGYYGILKRERLINLSEYRNNQLPLQNIDKNPFKTITPKADMADLTHLHEASILYNLKARHASSLPYTRVGDILVAVNPFRWIEGLYSKERQDFYATNIIWQAHNDHREGGCHAEEGQDCVVSRKAVKKTCNDATVQPLLLATAASERKAIGYDYEKLGIQPHVYETSSLAYLGLSTDRIDQTILVTGESGAGKTESIKIVMNHLATVERSRPGWPESDRVVSSSSSSLSEFRDGSDTVTKVLQANPLFEAFGNAKTLRNDNSSRFGKFIELQFDVETSDEAQRNGRGISSCHLAGSKCITYLLEKSRVVFAGEGERTFHIFYQLLGATDEDKRVIWNEGLVGASTEDFAYLNKTPPDDIDGLAAPQNWPKTVAALSTFGIHGNMFLNIARSLCIVLQLGNIVFDMQIQNSTERSVISSREELAKLSSLLGVPAAEIETALTTRFMVTRGEEFTIFLKPNEAKDGCDALAKEVC